ncbi:hypothetical protein TanjilG_08460 [Lupinus angustifolius]|uniref:F-box domain-containing protein n=1 Tax=Lupinus angustifolius TaxID=3871 RepID=A0A1J7I0I9_LUPAN|nr:PREDICTED: F-box/kelch-repeat protein At3g24760 isoform X1 [Lupinus angustifolius]XP_019450189.1 PREDICTED: F-box/kelch-repeat protein At3g24760 isoform X2 [Lupinus angustifolius]OIW07573.1 hypothetical protein TanjilG_08460 [Lupinus angustifolius]
MTTHITHLSSDLIELILSFLPISTLIKSSIVCKLWHSIISSFSFSTTTTTNHHHKPWFFLHGIHNISSKNNQSFAFDPTSNSWFQLTPFLTTTPNQNQNQPNTSFIGTNGFFFITAPMFCYTTIMHPSWHATKPLHFPRINPLIGVFNDGFVVVVGGVKFIGNLVDIEEPLDVEIYDPSLGSWKLCPPLPGDFRSGNSSSSLSSALFKKKFYVFGIYSCFVSSFDLEKHVWSDVHTLRPHGVVFSFLVSCRKQLVLAGICNLRNGSCFNLWKIDDRTMEFNEIGTMPHDLLYDLFDGDEDDKFASLKCVGLGDLIYVFNEDYHRVYPACVCEIDDESGKCSWRKVPQLPSPVNKFHKVISFCSTISLHSVLGQHQHLGIQ